MFGSPPNRRVQRRSLSTDDPMLSADVFLRPEGAAEDRLHPEHVEESGRDAGTAQRFGTGLTADVERAELHQGHALEGAALTLPVEEIGGRYGELGHAWKGVGWRHVPDERQTIGFGVGQRPQQDRIDHAEDGGVGADTERQDEDRRDRKTRALAEHTHRVPDVAAECLEGWKAPSIAMALSRHFHASKLQDRLPARFLLRQAAPYAVVHVQLDVAFELGVEVAVAALRPEGAAQANQPGAQPPHGCSFGDRNRSTIAVVCCHSRAAFSSCFRPARVSR